MRRGFLVTAVVIAISAVQGRAQSTNTHVLVEHYARRYNLEPEFIAAFIDVESRWNTRAVSNKGALGLMQLMPATAKHFGAVDPFDPEQNIAAGTRYLTALMWEFHGDMRMVAAAYYAGEQRIGTRLLNYNNADVIAYVESIRRHYVKRIAAATVLPEK